MKKRIEINYPLNWIYNFRGTPINQIREDLDELERLGATHVDIYSQKEDELDDESFTLIRAIMERDETEEEYIETLEKHKEYLNRIRTLEITKDEFE